MATFGVIKQTVQDLLERPLPAQINTIIRDAQISLEDDLLNAQISPMRFTVSSLTAPQNPAVTTATSGGTLADDTTYYYVVTAYNVLGETTPSSEVSVNIPAATGSTNSNTIIWDYVDGAEGYKIYVNTASGSNLLLASISSPDVLTYTHTSGTGSGSLPTENTTITLAQSVNSITIPHDFLQMDSFYLIDPSTGNRVSRLQPRPSSTFKEDYTDTNSTNTGTPWEYMEENNQFIFDKYTDKAYTVDFTYYRRLPPLLKDGDTNWFTRSAEKALRYAAAMESIPWINDPLGEDAHSAGWIAKYNKEKYKIEQRYGYNKVAGYRENTHGVNATARSRRLY